MAVATATTKLTAEDRQLQRGLGKGISAIKRYAKKVKAVMIAVAKSIAVVGAIAGALAWNFVKAASDFEETRSKFKAVFKELTGEATTFVNELSRSLGRSKLALTGFMATLQDTFVPLGFAREEGLRMSKTLVQLTLDLASFNNQAESDVIRDLQSAIVGNHETMRKYGVIITETSLKQEILNSGIATNWKLVTAAQKAQARMNIIINGTSDAQGDAARTSGEFAGQMRTLKSQIENIRVELGIELMPLAKDLVGILKDLTKDSAAFAKGLRVLVKRSQQVAIWGQMAALGLTAWKRSMKETGEMAAALLIKWWLLKREIEKGLSKPKKDPVEEQALSFEKARKQSKAYFDEFIAGIMKIGRVEPPGVPTGAVQLEKRAVRLEMGDLPDVMEGAAEDFEVALRPRFEGLEESWNRITETASTKERKPAEKTAEATKETADETKKIKESNDKIEGWMGDAVDILGEVRDGLKLTAGVFKDG